MGNNGSKIPKVKSVLLMKILTETLKNSKTCWHQDVKPQLTKILKLGGEERVENSWEILLKMTVSFLF